MQDYKVSILNFFDIFTLYELAAMGCLFVLFVLFFILGILLRSRRFFPKFFFALAFLVFVSGPFVLRYCIEDVFYKLDIEIIQSKPLVYVDSLLLEANITNIGLLSFSTCKIRVDIMHDNWLKFLGSLYPKKTYQKTMSLHLNPTDTTRVSILFDRFSHQMPFDYRVYITCHARNNLLKHHLM